MRFGDKIGLWLARRKITGQFWQVLLIVWLFNSIVAVSINYLIYMVWWPEFIASEGRRMIAALLFICTVLTVPFVYIDFWLVRALMQSRNALQEEARRDYLTGLVNRRGFEEKVRAYIGAGRRKAAYLLIDLDYFKKVNDLYGHKAGDALLKRIASSLVTSVRDGDIVARIGGEELGVFMPGATEEEAIRIAHRLRRQVRNSIVYLENRNGAEVYVTASIGIVDCAGIDSYSEAYAKADVALYRAKSEGRNRVALARPPSASEGRADKLQAAENPPHHSLGKSR